MNKEFLLIRHRKKLKLLKPTKWFVNRNTPVGDPADFYEVKPYDGQRYIPGKEIIGFIEDGKIRVYQWQKNLLLEPDVAEYLKNNKIEPRAD